MRTQVRFSYLRAPWKKHQIYHPLASEVPAGATHGAHSSQCASPVHRAHTAPRSLAAAAVRCVLLQVPARFASFEGYFNDVLDGEKQQFVMGKYISHLGMFASNPHVARSQLLVLSFSRVVWNTDESLALLTRHYGLPRVLVNEKALPESHAEPITPVHRLHAEGMLMRRQREGAARVPRREPRAHSAHRSHCIQRAVHR